MTKMKSKKMTKSTFAVIIMGIIMVAMLAFGGTFAYFTATSTDVAGGSVKTAVVALNAKGASVTNAITRNIVPGEKAFEQDASVVAKHSSTTATYVFVKMSTDNEMYVKVNTEDKKVFGLVSTANGVDGETWTELEYGIYYLKVAAVEAETSLPAFSYNVQFHSAVQAKKVENAQGQLTEQNNVYTKSDDTTTPVPSIENIDVVVTLNFYAVQQFSFEDASSAWASIATQVIS